MTEQEEIQKRLVAFGKRLSLKPRAAAHLLMVDPEKNKKLHDELTSHLLDYYYGVVVTPLIDDTKAKYRDNPWFGRVRDDGPSTTDGVYLHKYEIVEILSDKAGFNEEQVWMIRRTLFPFEVVEVNNRDIMPLNNHLHPIAREDALALVKQQDDAEGMQGGLKAFALQKAQTDRATKQQEFVLQKQLQDALSRLAAMENAYQQLHAERAAEQDAKRQLTVAMRAKEAGQISVPTVVSDGERFRLTLTEEEFDKLDIVLLRPQANKEKEEEEPPRKLRRAPSIDLDSSSDSDEVKKGPAPMPVEEESTSEEDEDGEHVDVDDTPHRSRSQPVDYGEDTDSDWSMDASHVVRKAKHRKVAKGKKKVPYETITRGTPVHLLGTTNVLNIQRDVKGPECNLVRDCKAYEAQLPSKYRSKANRHVLVRWTTATYPYTKDHVVSLMWCLSRSVSNTVRQLISTLDENGALFLWFYNSEHGDYYLCDGFAFKLDYLERQHQ